MLPDHTKEFLSCNHSGVFSAFRKNGAAHLSLVTCGLFRNGVAFTSPEGVVKLSILKRNNRCSLLISQLDWRDYVVLEGWARIFSLENTGSIELRQTLRSVFKAASGTEHPDWDEYDQAMLQQKRAAILVIPERVYGTRA